MKKTGANDLLRLRLKARDLEEERHDLPGAVETYGKAAAMGDPVAMEGREGSSMYCVKYVLRQRGK